MSAADVSAIVDLLSAPEATPSPETPTPEVDTPTPESTTPETPESTTPAPESESGGDAAPAPDPTVDARTNPAQVRSALKTLRDSDPKNAPIARELNDAYGRYQAYKDSFPTVADARNAKAFLEANGGIEGLTSLHETIKSVNETDDLLYNGDPRVLDNIIEDLRKENKLDAFPKLAGPFLDKLRGLNEKAYYEAMRPHFYQGLIDTNVIPIFQDLAQVLAGDAPDLTRARAILGNLSKWFDALRDSVKMSEQAKLDPDRQAFEKERTEFQTAKQKEFQTGVANEAESHNNSALGGALKPYLSKPYFKNIRANRDSMISLYREVKSTLMEELNADKTYRSQMDAFFAQKSPDKSRIVQYHKAKVDGMTARIAKQVIERRWPDYDRRVGPAAANKPAPAAPVAQTPGKPEYVKAKPEWNSIDWDKDPSKLLFVTGKAYLKSGKFVYWGKERK